MLKNNMVPIMYTCLFNRKFWNRETPPLVHTPQNINKKDKNPYLYYHKQQETWVYFVWPHVSRKPGFKGMRYKLGFGSPFKWSCLKDTELKRDRGPTMCCIWMRLMGQSCNNVHTKENWQLFFQVSAFSPKNSSFQKIVSWHVDAAFFLLIMHSHCIILMY